MARRPGNGPPRSMAGKILDDFDRPRLRGDDPHICGGCNVRGVWEHRCYRDEMQGEPPCECPECNPSLIEQSKEGE